MKLSPKLIPKLNFNYLNVLLGAIAMLVLTLLFNFIRLNNPQQEAWLLKKIHQTTLVNEQLNQNLWRYQFGVISNFNEITKNTGALQQLKTTLAEGEYPVNNLEDANITRLFNDLDLKLTAKEQQVNDFFDAKSTLKKNINFTLRQIEDVPKNSNGESALQQLKQALWYAADLNVAQEESVLRTINAQVLQTISSYPKTQQFFVEQIVSQVNEIIEKNKRIFQMLETATQASDNNLTQDFETALHVFFEQRQRTIFYIQSFLFIISLISIAYATYLLLKLNRKENDLKKALSDVKNLEYAFDQHAIISFSDAAGNFTRVNEKFCLLSEYSQQELIGKNHWMMHAGENSDKIYQDMGDKAAQGIVWHGELKSKTNTGKSYWVNATVVPFMNETNQVYQLISIRTDITLSKRLEEQITESKNFIQKLTDTMAQGVFSIDKQGMCTFWNKQAEFLLGWSKREMVLRHIEPLITYMDDTGKNIAWDDDFLSDQTQLIEVRVRSKAGVVFPVALTVAPLHEGNKIVGHVLVFQDISERKEQQRLLHEAMQAAESANHTKSAFLANMSHEIRTPMNGIIGMTDLALDTELTTEQREFLNIAKNSAASLLTIINDILDFSKIEAGKLELDAIEFDLYQTLRETIKNLSIRAYQKGLEMIIDTAPDVPRYLIGDPGRLSQIIINLIGNAIKFTEKGEIVVRVRLNNQKDQQTCLQFAVEDTGIGIPEDQQKNVFSSFSQVDASIFRKFGGTGLGLSIAKQLVELMHGHIGVTSQLNKGTSFQFTAWFRSTEREINPIKPLAALNQMRVLVVEDNKCMLNVMGRSLTQWGMQVMAVKNAAEALTLLRREKTQGKPLQLLIIDEGLVDVDGFTLVAQLQREALSSAPVIILLSSIYSVGKARRQDVNIASIISKPASQSDLLDAIHTLFNGPVSQSLLTKNSDDHYKVLKPLDILLAEDNAINQQLAIKILEKQGHTVTVANNGEECLACVAEHRYDLILMDFQMPVMDGLEASRRLRQQGNDLPIIAMTANAMKGDRERAIEAGMTDYLTKPIRVNELFDVLSRYFPEVERNDNDPIPFFNDPGSQLSTIESLQSPKLLKPLDILLTEDNVINQELAVKYLEKQGHRVNIANNGVECLARLSERVYDLVLMDFQMPVMDGLEASRRIRQQGNMIPIIAITANAQKGDRERAMAAGMTDYMTKPINVIELFEVIGRYFPALEAGENRAPIEQKLELEIPEAEAASIRGMASVCDWQGALDLLGGDEEILTNMAEMYITNADSYVADIKKALEARSEAELARGLHTLKGIFALFKSRDAEQLLISTEQLAHNAEISQVAKALPEIKLYVKALMTFLQDKLKVSG